MAFNPFNWFRKHQKVFFAGLTILCMVVFIGSFGAGDLFQNALRRLGGRYARETLITLNGKRIAEIDLQNLARQRKMANDFLFVTAWNNHPKTLKSLKDKVKNDAPDNPLAGLRAVVDRAEQRSGIMLLLQMQRERPEELQSSIQADLRLVEDISRREKVQDNTDRLDILQEVAAVLGFQAWLVQRPNVIANFSGFNAGRRQILPEDLCFGGSLRPDDLLDFLVWQHQADRLGLTLTDTDLAKEINREAAGQDVFDDKTKSLEREKQIGDFVKNREYGNQAQPSILINALREEFRVAMAQGLLVGSEPGIRGYRSQLGAVSTPAAGTPDEFLRYYREQRTTLRVKMLNIPVSAFVSKVTSTPGEQELRNRYERYREREPLPYSREPGFKEPRRIAVEYVTASPDDPFYRDAARKQALAWQHYSDPQTRAVSSFGLLAGTAVTGPFATAALALDPYQEEYEKYVKEQAPWIIDPNGDDRSFSSSYKLHMSSVLEPATIAATIGSLFASAQGGGGQAFSAPGTLYSSAAFPELRDSLKVNVAMLLARSTSPGTSWDSRGALPLSPLTAVALTIPYLPKLLPRETLAPQLLSDLEKRIAESALKENLKALGAELAKLKSKDRAVIRDYLEKAVKDYHLTLHSMPQPLQQQVIIEQFKRKVDLKIGGLQKAFLKRNPSAKIEDFVPELFQGNGTYAAQELFGVIPQPQEFFFWRTEDLPARTRPYSAVRAEVEAAWRFEEARKLARKEAERLEDEINKMKATPADAERLLREQKLGDLFELDNVAQLVPPAREVHPFRRIDYVPYEVPASVVDELTYPPQDMVKHLLELKRPGEATVFADLPAKHYYVAVLFNRDEPTVKQFEALYKRPPLDDQLYNRFSAALTDEYRRSVMDQLRRDAGKVDKDGRFVLPEGYRKRGEGGRGGEEE